MSEANFLRIFAHLNKVINIGRAGERNATQVIFDVSKWYDRYGDTGTFILAVEQGSSSYIALTTREDNYIVWTVTEEYTSIYGRGRCELSYQVGNVIVKSLIYDIVVTESIEGNDDIPEPYESWLTEVRDEASGLGASVQAAEAARDEAVIAQGLAEGAKIAAQTAKIAAETARTGAETARTGAETARTGAETARTGALAAETGAVNAKNLILTSIVDNLTTNDSTKALSAKQGKILSEKVLTDVPAGAVFTDTDTITTINGKTGAITKADIVALGIPAQDTIVDISGKVDKVAGKGLSTNDFTTPLLTKLNGVEAEANKYVHPSKHPASIITQDANNRFVTDTEKSTWNNKQNNLGYTPLNSNLKGANNGLAELDSGGRVPASQLPSYVDDVLEYSNFSALPTTGEAGKIYVTLNTNIIYRWSGTGYTEISASLALGETSGTAYQGDRGKIAYDHSQATHAPTTAQKNSDITKAEIEARLTGVISSHSHTVTKGDVGLGNVDNTSDLSKPISTAQQAALNLKEAAFTKNTAFNKNFGSVAGTVTEGNDSRLSDSRPANGGNSDTVNGKTVLTNVPANAVFTDTVYTAGENISISSGNVISAAGGGEGGSGKKCCSFIVGATTSGYTIDDVDYLCDGINDQVEINAAITALPTDGGEIIILDGTYNITAKINLNKSNVTISGNGNSTILKRMYDSGRAEGVITLTSANYCKIKDLQIDGNKATYASSNNIGIYLNSSSNNTITGNTCDNNTYGILLNSSSNNTVTGNTCNDNNTYGIYLNSNSNNNTITGNTCDNNTAGILLNFSSNNTVTGNTCDNNTYGIRLNSSSNNTVTGNTCIRGIGIPADYTVSQYTIILNGTTNNYNLIAINNCMGKAVFIGGGTGNSVYGNKWEADIDVVVKTDIVDNLTTNDSTKPLSAKQGSILAGKVLTNVPANAVFTDTVTDVVDNLTTDSSVKALSAKQGKILNEKITTQVNIGEKQYTQTSGTISLPATTINSLYGTCTTAAATVEKTLTITDFTLYTGAVVYIKFTFANTATSPTLNINGTGAKLLKAGGVNLKNGHLIANRVYGFIYDGESYEALYAPTVWE